MALDMFCSAKMACFKEYGTVECTLHCHGHHGGLECTNTGGGAAPSGTFNGAENSAIAPPGFSHNAMRRPSNTY
jgi:hypothetical protein